MRTSTAPAVRRAGAGELAAAVGPLAHRAVPPIRAQWCHGAPGMVTTLAVMAPGDDAFTALLVAAAS